MASYVYSSCSPITTGCYLYTDACLTTAASTGRYSNGTDCYTVTTGGYVSAVESCGGSSYYTYATTAYTCDGTTCVTTTQPASGYVGYTSTLTAGYYYLDANDYTTIYYIGTYIGYGNYGAWIIDPTAGSNASCNVLCSL